MITIVIPKQHILHSFFFGWLYGVGAVKVGGYVSEFQIKFSYFHELRYRFSRKAENFFVQKRACYALNIKNETNAKKSSCFRVTFYEFLTHTNRHINNHKLLNNEWG